MSRSYSEFPRITRSRDRPQPRFQKSNALHQHSKTRVDGAKIQPLHESLGHERFKACVQATKSSARCSRGRYICICHEVCVGVCGRFCVVCTRLIARRPGREAARSSRFVMLLAWGTDAVQKRLCRKETDYADFGKDCTEK